MKKILALIPARGGSKGIKRKNIVDLNGKPLIAYTIETCLRSKWINRTVVSTDDPQIARIARQYGAEAPFMRPKKFAGDLSPDNEFLFHALKWLKDEENYVPDAVLNMRPVCPCRDVRIVDKAIKTFLRHPEADSLRAVCPAKETPYKMWEVKGRYMTPLIRDRRFKESWNMPRQVLRDIYFQHGYVDIMRPEVILKDKLISGKKVLPFFCENPVDIDYPEDLAAARKILESRK